MSRVQLNFSDELNRLVAASVSAAGGAQNQISAFLPKVKTRDGQEFVLQLFSHFLVAIEWLPELQKKAFLIEQTVRSWVATDERVKQTALANAIGGLTILQQALQMSRTDELEEIVKKLSDAVIDGQTFGLWKIFTTVKDIVSYKAKLFKDSEKLAEWSEKWRSELRWACCRAMLAVQPPSVSFSVDKSLLQIAAEEIQRVEREYDDCQVRKLLELRREAQNDSM